MGSSCCIITMLSMYCGLSNFNITWLPLAKQLHSSGQSETPQQSQDRHVTDSLSIQLHVWLIGLRARPETLLKVTIIFLSMTTKLPVTNCRKLRKSWWFKFPMKVLRYPSTLAWLDFISFGSLIMLITDLGVALRALYKSCKSPTERPLKGGIQ